MVHRHPSVGSLDGMFHMANEKSKNQKLLGETRIIGGNIQACTPHTHAHRTHTYMTRHICMHARTVHTDCTTISVHTSFNKLFNHHESSGASGTSIVYL